MEQDPTQSPQSGPEYVSPWAGYGPTEPGEASLAAAANDRLIESFFMGPQTLDRRTIRRRAARAIRILEAYQKLSIRAAAEGIPEADMASYIKEGMRMDAFIDPVDGVKADEEFTIISQGYERNRQYWDEKIGRRRRFRNDLRLMGDDLGNQQG